MQYSYGVCIVDDDAEIHEPFARGFALAGLTASSFRSAEELLASPELTRAGCVVTDIQLPGISGLELQEELRRRRVDVPIVVMSGQATVGGAVQAFRSGASEFFEKPLCFPTFVHRVTHLVAAHQRHRQQQEGRRARLDSLSQREVEVLQSLVSGASVKSIARDLGISPSTVEKHRARVLQKTDCDSVIELTRWMLGASA